MRKNVGSSLVEYALPLALIGVVVGMGLISIFSGDNLLGFITSTTNVQYDKATQKAVFNKNVEETALINDSVSELTSENKMTDCLDGFCKLNLGSVVLNGIPENFNEFIETAGASGGSDKIAELMTQIADQLEAEGLEKESMQVKKLAVMGHNMAAMQKSVEKIVNDCNNDTKCIEKYGNMIAPKPEGYDETYGNYDTDMKYKDFATSSIVGGFRNLKESVSPVYNIALNHDRPASEFVDTLDSITANGKISQETKNVIKELAWDIGVIGEDFQNNVEFLADGWFDGALLLSEATFYDPLTTKTTKEKNPTDVVSNFINYKASKITHFDSALICVAGMNRDSGSRCH